MNEIARLLLRVAGLALCVLEPLPALAQGAAAAAEALFEQGREGMDTGQYDQACDKFRESDNVQPAVGTKLNLAYCEEKRGRLATAWELFKAVEGAVDSSDDRYSVARQHREALESQVPRLRLVLESGAPEDTVTRIGDVTLGTAAFGAPLPLDPGEHELVVSAPRHQPTRVTVVLSPGSVAEVVIAPGPLLRPSLPPRPQVSPPIPRSVETAYPATRGQRTLGYVLAGTGIASLIVGGATGILALKHESRADEHCNPIERTCDQTGVDANRMGRRLAPVSTVGLVVGSVATGIGTYFILTSRRGAHTALAARVVPFGSELSFSRDW